MSHKAGFVNIVGKPNAGKSTLMNAMVGEKLSVITPKAQTTRHRILGIVNEPGIQIVFSDTPGILEPRYALHKAMMSSVHESLRDADILLLVTSVEENPAEHSLLPQLRNLQVPLAVLINKADLSDETSIKDLVARWKDLLRENAPTETSGAMPPETLQTASREVFVISAKFGYNVEAVYQFIKDKLPEHPPYYGEDELTDRNARFFVSEILRGKIFEYSYKEIPYSTEVVVLSFREEPGIDRISCEIVTERESQKNILIGRNGETLKKIATAARLEMEDFLQKKVFLEVHVKVIKDWRNRQLYLKQFGYE